MCLFDEAHHICTEKIVNLLTLFNDCRMYYFTATPKENKVLNMYMSNDNITGDNNITGGIIYRYDFKDAFEANIICDYILVFTVYRYH